MKKDKTPWYEKTGLKHVTGFLTPAEKAELQLLAKSADKSLTRYVTRLLERHLQELRNKTDRR